MKGHFLLASLLTCVHTAFAHGSPGTQTLGRAELREGCVQCPGSASLHTFSLLPSAAIVLSDLPSNPCPRLAFFTEWPFILTAAGLRETASHLPQAQMQKIQISRQYCSLIIHSDNNSAAVMSVAPGSADLVHLPALPSNSLSSL